MSKITIFSGMTMTPRDALARQTRDVKHYAHYLPNLAELVAAKTNIEGINLDAPLAIQEINKRIPRGGAIEFMCGVDFGGN